MKKCFFLALFFWLVTPLHAKSKNTSQKIIFQRNAPREVTQSLPGGVKSYFWGTFRLRKNGRLYSVCLYDPNWKQNDKNFQSGKKAILHADIFSHKNKKWHRERHCTIRYFGYIGRRMQVGVDLLWLNVKKQSGPIFKFTIFGYDPYENKRIQGAGDELLLIFPSGFSSTYALNKFSVGYWRASGTLGQDVHYNGQDERGFLKIFTHESLNDDIYTDRDTSYKWNSKANHFVATSSEIYGGYGKRRKVKSAP